MKIFKNLYFIYGLYILIAIEIGIQKFLLGSHNNFNIYQHCVYHFFDHVNLYITYPKEYFDLFLYNPSFVFIFLPFAYLPSILGAVLWSIFTVSVYFLAIKSLPFPERSRLFIFYLIIPELITALTNYQTNPLIAAFTVLAMTSLENERYGLASVFPALNFYIKGYGGIAGIFFFLKKPRIKTFIYIAVSFILIGALPLLFYTFSEFKTLYAQWFESLGSDYVVNTGVSVMAFIKSVIYKDISIPAVQIAGASVFMMVFFIILFRKNYEDVKYYFLASVLIFMIIFNQAAESSGYIIASTGAFIWYVNSRKTWLDLLLFILFYVLTVMSPSDLFPKYLRVNYVTPYALKALPCVLIWIKIQVRLIFPNFEMPKTLLWKRQLI
jgi:hypothetical protein